MTVTRSIDAMPTRVARLPRTPDARQFPVPWFASWIDGKPDFRIADGRKLRAAMRNRLCWMCGNKLTRHACFVLGPMCTVTRTSAEPGCHRDCAEYAATHCPFLLTPRMTRREAGKPDAATVPAGEMIRRNPGVTALWITRHWDLFDDGRGGTLFKVGEPSEVLWYAEGRAATRSEVLASIESGLPILREMAETEGRDAVDELDRLTEIALRYVPSGGDVV